jgi:hypothetical protein
MNFLRGVREGICNFLGRVAGLFRRSQS